MVQVYIQQQDWLHLPASNFSTVAAFNVQISRTINRKSKRESFLDQDDAFTLTKATSGSILDGITKAAENAENKAIYFYFIS